MHGVGIFPKFNKWVGFDKQGVRKFFSKQTILLSVYTLKFSMKIASYSTKPSLLQFIHYFDLYRLCNSHFIQQLVLDDDCCISQNIGGT